MKLILGILAIAIGIYSYIPYFRDIVSGKTKPHAFTWFVWFLLTSIAFFAQLSDGGGAGSWVTGFTALVSLLVTVIALRVGRQNIVKIDWLFLAGSLFSLVLWFFSKDPTWSMVLITIIDALAFLPTFRKSYTKPDEETLLTYALSAVKFAIGIAALNAFSLTTVLYPVSLVVTNGLFVMMVVIRRRQRRACP